MEQFSLSASQPLTLPVGEALPREEKRGYELLGATPFVAIHLAVFGAIWSGVTPSSIVWCLALVWIRLFFVTGGYHRYFSHRSYKTSRVMQFLIAFCAQTSSQKGALWWASHHRGHHKYSDKPGDAHSPVLRG